MKAIVQGIILMGCLHFSLILLLAVIFVFEDLGSLSVQIQQSKKEHVDQILT